MDHAALEAQELWLACSALQSAIETDGADGSEVSKAETFFPDISANFVALVVLDMYRVTQHLVPNLPLTLI